MNSLPRTTLHPSAGVLPTMAFRKDLQRQTHTAAEAPRLQLDELFSPTMALNHFFSDSPTPEQPNGNSISSKPENNIQLNGQHTPTRQQPGNLSRISSPPPPSDVDLSLNSPHLLSGSATPSSEQGNIPWSSAVGRAGTGKSGRVIEKLMGDNDRLQREKKLATVKLEEEVKRSESARSALEGLQMSNANLVSIHEADKSFLAKKDRRIEELRADLEAERSRRENAERETRASRRERDEMVEKLRREAAEDKEHAKRSNSQYEVLLKCWRSMEDKYERQAQKLKNDLKGLRRAIDSDREKLAQLEVIMEQLRQEGDKTRKAKDRLSSDFQAYKAEQESGVQGIRQRAEQNESTHDRTLRQMEALLGQMKYVVNLKNNIRDAE